MATRWPEPSFEGLDTTSPVELANNFEDYYKDVFMYTLKNPTAAAPARYVMDIMFQANKIMALMKSEIAVPGSGYVAASVDPAPNPNPNPNPRPEELKREEVDVDAFPVSIPYARVHNAPPPPQVPDPAARFEQMMANLDQSTRQYHVDGDRDNEHDGHDGVDDGAVEYFRPGDFMDNAMDSEQEDSDWDDESEETDSEFYEYSEGSDAEPEEETGIETGTGTETEYYEYTEGSAVNTEKECGAIKTECEAAEPEKLEELHEADDEKEPDEGTLKQVPIPTPRSAVMSTAKPSRLWVKIRWDNSASPLQSRNNAHYKVHEIVTMIETAMERSGHLEWVKISAIRPHPISGDLDILFSSEQEQMNVVAFSGEWLPHLWQGAHARLPQFDPPPRQILGEVENTMRGPDTMHPADEIFHKQPEWQAGNSPTQSQREYDMRLQNRREKQRGKRQRQKMRKRQRETSLGFGC